MTEPKVKHLKVATKKRKQVLGLNSSTCPERQECGQQRRQFNHCSHKLEYWAKNCRTRTEGEE